ncbi:MAG: hypothetical protein HY562_05595 [Ignavibacteriales bacterium]|nr:hypothetical protein [Ignavibacteriales bacterium]
MCHGSGDPRSSPGDVPVEHWPHAAAARCLACGILVRCRRFCSRAVGFAQEV